MKISSTLLRLMTIFVLATGFNFIWELWQMPFYVGTGTLLQQALHCLIPSIGDAAIVLTIFAIGWVLFGRVSWADKPGKREYVVIFLIGLSFAILVEWIGVYMFARWQYSAKMPLIPILHIGMIPVGQMLLLPPLIFALSRR